MPTPRMKHIREPEARVSVEEFQHTRNEVDALRAKLEETEAALEHVTKENSEHEATNLELQKQNRLLTGRLAATETKLASTEGRRDELDALRIENDIMRRKLQRFEQTVGKLEAKVKGGAGKSPRPSTTGAGGTIGGGSTVGGASKSHASPRPTSPTVSLEGSTFHLPSTTDRTLDSTTIGGDLHDLQSLTEQIHIAKTEAIQFTTQGKRQLADDVKYLYGLLQRAKEEHKGQQQVQNYLRRRVVELEKEVKEVRHAAGLKERAFTLTLTAEMNKMDKRVRKAETDALTRKQQVIQLVEWAQSRHAAFTALTRDLQVQVMMEKEEAAGMLEEETATMQAELDEMEKMQLPQERKPIAIQRAEAAAQSGGGKRRSKGHGSFASMDSIAFSQEQLEGMSEFAREMLDANAPG